MRRLVALLALASGCGFSPPPDLACSDVAKVYCEKESSCSDGAGIVRGFGDLPTCLARRKLLCTLTLQAPSSGATPASAEACAIALQGVSCADFSANDPPPACLYAGGRGMGAPCAFDAQCASGYCGGNKTSACGTCGTPPVAGAPCTSSTCAHGEQCVARTSTCEEIPTAGMPCDLDTLPCATSLYCAGNTSGQMGTCAPAIPTLGAACGGTLGACDPQRGLTCTGVTPVKSCQEMVYAASGRPCGNLPDGSFAACGDGGLCYTSTGVALAGEAGQCKAAAADGAPCDVALGPPCLLPARCLVSGGGTAGVCTLPSGSACGG